MPHSWNEELLILTKTYPNPSSKYRETTCVAAVNHENKLRRLFPVPFRLLDGSQKFNKWEWVKSVLHKASDDHRPESHQLHIDTLKRIGRKVTTENAWANRIRVIQGHLVESIEELERRRQASGETLGFVGPVEILSLDIRASKNPEWTDADIKILTQESLFDSEDVHKLKLLKKLPHEFRYTYRLHTDNVHAESQHLITDWEAGALYWNCLNSGCDDWEIPFRERLMYDFSRKDLYFMMGTVHRFPDTWLIVGLYYPPKYDPERETQEDLF